MSMGFAQSDTSRVIGDDQSLFFLTSISGQMRYFFHLSTIVW